MKLFTLGDSISQGLMSLGVARTDLAYSTWIARALGLDVGDAFSSGAYRVPEYPANGLLLNLESVMRGLFSAFGSDITLTEWPRFAPVVNAILDVAEEHYERGEGSRPYRGGAVPWFHNVSTYGCDIADAWLVTPRICRERIAAAPGRGDGFLNVPNASFFRTALRVLNPSWDPMFDDFAQLDWLRYHARREGVDNVLLWLGPNNAVGAAIQLDIAETPNDPSARPVSLSFAERTEMKWNLWHPLDFRAEYTELLDRLDEIMRENKSRAWRVFAANVPHVTSCPVAREVGSALPGEPCYFPYYTYPPLAVSQRAIDAGGPRLTADRAKHIDRTIDGCNAEIAALLAAHNERHGDQRYHLVDMAGAMDRLDYRRNAGRPRYVFPASFFDHVALPMDTRYYHVDRDGRRVAGGLVSLDGVHPTAIGQGLVAHEFLEAMKRAGVPGADPDALSWKDIVASDTLYQSPIPLMPEVYEHEELAVLAVEAYRALLGGFEGRRVSIKDF